MNHLSITVCSFHLRKFNSKTNKDIYDLNKNISYINDNEDHLITTVKEMFMAFSSSYSESKKDDDKKKTFSCTYLPFGDFSTEKYNGFSFEIQSGYYGSSSTILDADTREKKYEMTPNDVAEKKFYLYVIIPKDNRQVIVNKGILIFQNIGIFGVKTITYENLFRFLSETYNISISCATISPELFVKKIVTKNNIKKMIMVKNHKSTNDTDLYYNGFGSETRIISKLCFSDTIWEKIVSAINIFIKGKANLFEFQNIEYDKLKLLVKIGEKDRTIDLHNLDKLSIIEEIPDYIQDEKGYADFIQLTEYIKSTVDDYLQEMVFRIQ